MDRSTVWIWISVRALFLRRSNSRENYEDGHHHHVNEYSNADMVCVGTQKTEAFRTSIRNAEKYGAAALNAAAEVALCEKQVFKQEDS